MSDWVSVKEPPLESGSVLVLHSGVCRVACWDAIRRYFQCSVTGRVMSATHWMPLPAPPSLPPTKDEALREAVAAIEGNQERLKDYRIIDPVGRLYECHQMTLALLPRLRAALGET